MSADSEEKRPRRRPLSRSRKLGSRRRRGRRGRGEDEEEENEEEGSEDSGDSDAAEPAEAAAAPPIDTSEQTVPVNKIPSPGGSGTPTLGTGAAPPPPAERWAKMRGAARRFGGDFSKFLVGLGQSAQERGTKLNENVVKPVSHALVEAAICLILIFICGIFGVMFGSYLKKVTAEGGKTVAFQNREVRPGQQMDESFFSQGFDTKELHQRANRVLEDHLSALRRAQFVEAYGLLSPAWKEQLSYPTFETGYLNTRVIAYEIGKVETLDPQRIRLRADLKVEEGGYEKIYSAVYIAVLTPEGWRLDGGTFQTL
jgi:hypothetical protein